MKQDIHPAYEKTTIRCGCGASVDTRSTKKDDISVEICSSCHPFYTGKHKFIDTAGKVEKFKKRYGNIITKKA